MNDSITSNKANNNTTMGDNNGAIQRWNTPIPYLFGGLTLMLGLIAIALLILACSFRTSSSNGNNNNNNGNNKSSGSTEESVNDSRIVVIMAGDDNPTYLAKPKPLPCPMILPLTSTHTNFLERA